MKIEAKKFYWTRNKEIVYICEVEHNSYSYAETYGALGHVLYPEKSRDLTWTIGGEYNFLYSNHSHDLVEEVTDPVILALYED